MKHPPSRRMRAPARRWIARRSTRCSGRPGRLGKWTDAGVSDETLRELYELVKLGPTSGNGSPGRFVFVRTKEGKEKLRPALSAGNRRKDDGGPGDGDRRL